jgi:hypothetical protein
LFYDHRQVLNPDLHNSAHEGRWHHQRSSALLILIYLLHTASVKVQYVLLMSLPVDVYRQSLHLRASECLLLIERPDLALRLLPLHLRFPLSLQTGHRALNGDLVR